MRKIAVLFCIFIVLPFPFIFAEDFSALDAFIRSLPKPKTAEALSAVINENYKTDWEKTRAIYIWLTDNIKYDTDAFFSGRYPDSSAEAVFAAKKAVCEGYSSLFKQLADLTGLTAEKITGYAKGYGYSAKKSFSRTNHAWNAVKIEGTWRLFDATWGAGYVDGKKFVRSFSDFWFDTPPELNIHTHLPEDEQWQLTEKPITLSEYVALPFIPSYTFEAFNEIGVSNALLIDQLSQNIALPAAYGYDNFRVIVNTLPLSGSLEKGKEYSFALSGEGFDNAAIINAGKWTYMKKDEQGAYSTIVAAQKGNFDIGIKPIGKSQYSIILQYTVK